MRPALSLAAAVALLAGCGVPQELPKQAEEVASVAAEGSLLARDAVDGDTTETFTREHAKALRKQLRQVEPAIEDRDLEQLAAKVDEILGVLADRAGDGEGLARYARALERHADAAAELAS